MIAQVVPLHVRIDPAGSGHFGARRGGRSHRGIDYRCTPGLGVLSPAIGYVSKLGYCYSDDLTWRYVQVTDTGGLFHRLFYVDPSLQVGDRVTTESVVGVAQDISTRYPGQQMRPHVHYEVMRDGEYLNPETLA